MAHKNPALDLVFQALADPTRRAVLDQLRAGPVAITDLAAPHAMALPSFTKHIAMLEKAGLIRTLKKGRSRICSLRPARLALVDGWLAAHRAEAEDGARQAHYLQIARTLYPPDHAG
jgi:DNA-binding transcriptional ArsR family regulator